MSTTTEPTLDEIRAWLDAHPERNDGTDRGRVFTAMPRRYIEWLLAGRDAVEAEIARVEALPMPARLPGNRVSYIRGLKFAARGDLRVDRDEPRMTPDEIAEAERIGPPDFLLGGKA